MPTNGLDLLEEQTEAVNDKGGGIGATVLDAVAGKTLAYCTYRTGRPGEPVGMSCPREKAGSCRKSKCPEQPKLPLPVKDSGPNSCAGKPAAGRSRSAERPRAPRKL